MFLHFQLSMPRKNIYFLPHSLNFDKRAWLMTKNLKPPPQLDTEKQSYSCHINFDYVPAHALINDNTNTCLACVLQLDAVHVTENKTISLHH